MRIVFTAFAVLFTITPSFAQLQHSESPHLSLRTSLLAPLETDANVMLGLGLQWKSRWAFIVDGGYIFANLNGNPTRVDNERDRVRGLKLRTEFRYYLKDLDYRGRTTFYLAPVFHYKKVVTNRTEEFGMNCVNGDCDYFQIDTYRRIKREVGGLLTVGTFSPLFGGDRVAIETFVGLGIKVKKYRNTDFPTGASLLTEPNNGFFSFDRDGEFPMVPGGVKISFRLF